MNKDSIKTSQTKKGIIIKIDRTKCLSCGACTGFAPNTFELDDTMISAVKENSEDSLEVISSATEGCPNQAIKVEKP